MRLEKRTEFCTECSLAYYKPFYEPMWLAKIMWIRAHKQNHTLEKIDSVSEDYRNGVEDGEQRIINLIPEYMKTVLTFGHETASEQLIALIKGHKQ
jgi:hypothetical protein